MFKILAKIFNPKKLGDSIISGVDKAILTNEEKIDYMQKMLTLYEPYKLAQRILAILFSSVFLLIHLINCYSTLYLRSKRLRHRKGYITIQLQ